MTRLIVSLSLTTIAVFAFSQSKNLQFTKYGIEEGLPEEYARHILQDNQGFIWIGTQNGLVKFNGYHFKIFLPIK